MTDHSRVACALILVAFLAVPVTGSAGVDGSPHDLIAQRYVVAGEGGKLPDKCLFCHLPSIGGDPMPMEEPPPSVSVYSRSGLVCYSCHDGTTFVIDQVDASRNAFHPDSHPLLMGKLPPPRYETGQIELPIRQNKLECTTCHVPHDNTTRPFQRMPLINLCDICHLGMENRGYGTKNLSGGHPIHETLKDDAGLTSPISAQPSFMVPFPQSYPLRDGKEAVGVHWNLGGHLAAGSEGTLECFTCHAVHGGARMVPLPGLLATPPVRQIADEFCEGCHRGQRGDELKSPPYPNPGGTTTGRTYHPCDDDVSNGVERNIVIRARVEWPFGEAPTKPLLCITCHTAHGGVVGTPALRKPVLAATFCEECHLAENLTFHHPLVPADFSGWKCPPPTVDPLTPNAPPGLYCSSCHVAHNAGLGKKESNYIPILKENSHSDDLCLQCHPEDNPTCLEEDKGKVSHFRGNPLDTTTYTDLYPPERIDLWPVTKLYSLYGALDEKSIICLSCHTFDYNPESGLTLPLQHYLLANGGNDAEWGNDLGVYLCTGCHGLNPATKAEGHTHPLIDGNVSALSQAVAAPATYTINGHLNCDSCHRPHGAKVEGGYYIMEAVGGLNAEPKTVHPAIDYTVLCHLCHNKY